MIDIIVVVGVQIALLILFFLFNLITLLLNIASCIIINSYFLTQ